MITLQTRQLSFQDIKPKRKIRYRQILDRLMTGPKTAKEIAVELFDLELIPSTERNYTAPRLTELEKMGLVESKDKKKCQYTGKTVAVYEITIEGIEKRYMEQIRIAKDVIYSRNHNADIKGLVKGLMIESYLENGAQQIGEHCFGKSITDPCLGWDKTKDLILNIADAII